MKKQVALLLIGFFAQICFAQDIAFKQYTVHDGLVQMQIVDIFEDSKGYLWVGTKGGLSKFNGKSFENFKTNDGLISKVVHSIAEDSKGNIWFLCSNGISVYDGARIQSFPFPSDWVPSPGKLMITNEDSVYFWRKYEPQVLKFDSSQFQVIENVVYKGELHGAAYDKTSNKIFIISKEKGLCKIENNSLVLIKIKHGNYVDLIYDNKQIGFPMYRLNDGVKVSFFSLPMNTHLYDYDPKTKEIYNVNFDALPNSYYRIQGRNILQKVDKENKVVTKIGTIQYDFTKEIFRDSKGSYWLNSDEGLVQWFGEGIRNYTQEEFSYAWGFVEDTDGSIWIPKFGGALYHYKDDKITENTEYLKFAKSKNFYFGSLLDDNNNLLFAHTSGIFKYGKQGVEQLIPQGADARVTPFILYEDTERDLLLAGTRKGFDVFKNYKHFGYWGQNSNIHHCSYIISIGKDTTGAYWLGSLYGLSRFDWKSKTAVNYTRDNGRLPSTGVICTTRDSWGGMWFGGTDGLIKYDYEKDSIFLIPIPDIGEIGVVTEAKNKRLLVGATSGLYWIDLEKYYTDGKLDYFLMNQNNGYLGIEPTQNSFLNDSKGNLWLASSTITTKFDTDKLDFKNHPLETIIREINGEKIGYAVFNADSTIHVNTNKIKIRFETIRSNRPTKTEYTYILDGSSGDWSEWSSSNEVEFANLSSGEYIFKVKPRSNIVGKENKWSQLKIKIELPIYKEPFFSLGLIILLFFFLSLLGVIAFINHSRAKERDANNKKLADKNSRIETLHKELAHRVKNNLAFISALMSMQQSRLTNAEAKEAVKESELRLQSMSLLHRKLHLGEQTSFNIGTYLNELCANLQATYPYSGKQPQISIESDNLDMEGDPAMRLGLIINELVTNSFKYAFAKQENPQIKIVLKQTDNDSYRMTYHDNGVGIPADFDISKSNSLGLKLIHTMTKQLNGTVKVSNQEGAHFQFDFTQKKLAI